MTVFIFVWGWNTANVGDYLPEASNPEKRSSILRKNSFVQEFTYPPPRSPPMERCTKILEECLSASLDDPAFDPASIFAQHPELESELTRRWGELRTLGMVGGESPITMAGEDPPRGTIDIPNAPLGGRYRCVEVIGHGGMGTVFAANDLELNRRVAVKLVDARELSVGERTRLTREARTNAQLEHPSIAPVHDIGAVDDDILYFVMKLVDGQTLQSLVLGELDQLAPGPLSIDRIVSTLESLCDALAFAHSRGVIHRDLKPANVMLGAFGEVQLMDWGIARVEGQTDERRSAAESEDWSLTASGLLIGTPSYMSPEQADGRLSDINESTDVFGLGALMHFLLTGLPPYRDQSKELVLNRAVHADRNDDAWTQAPRAVPRELKKICLRALERDPGDRYADTHELLGDLRAYRSRAPGLAWRDGPHHRTVKWIARRPGWAGSIAALAIALALGSLIVTQRSTIDREKDRAWHRELQVAPLFLSDLQARHLEQAGDNYDLAASELIEWLGDNRIPIDDYAAVSNSIESLRANMSDPDVARSLDSLRTAYQSACRWTAVCVRQRFDPPSGTAPVEMGARQAAIVEKALRRTPGIAETWTRLKALRPLFVDTPWREEAWQLFTDQQFGMKTSERMKRVDALIAKAVDLPASDVEWLARLRGAAGSQHLPEFEELWREQPGTQRMAMTIAKFRAKRAGDALDYRGGAPTESLRAAMLGEGYARTALALDPGSSWARLDHARLLGDVADYYLISAQEFARTTGQGGDESGPAPTRLLSLAGEYRHASFGYRKRQILALREGETLRASGQISINLLQVLAQLASDYDREYDDVLRKNADSEGFGKDAVLTAALARLDSFSAEFKAGAEWHALNAVARFRGGDSTGTDYLEAALLIEPSSTQYRYLLANMLELRLRRDGNEAHRERALELMDELLKINPEDPRYKSLAVKLAR